jgi:hypothetical protein
LRYGLLATSREDAELEQPADDRQQLLARALFHDELAERPAAVTAGENVEDEPVDRPAELEPVLEHQHRGFHLETALGEARDLLGAMPLDQSEGLVESARSSGRDSRKSWFSNTRTTRSLEAPIGLRAPRRSEASFEPASGAGE